MPLTKANQTSFKIGHSQSNTGRTHFKMGSAGHLGYSHSEETKKKISESRKGKTAKENNPNWKGGLYGTERHSLMSTTDYRNWRNSVFKRDNYTCVKCSSTNLYLHADHIINWSDNKRKRFDVSNGQTLCYKCHYKKTFGRYNENLALLWGVPKQQKGIF